MTAVVESERWKTNPCARCGHAFESHEGGQDYPCGSASCSCPSWERAAKVFILILNVGGVQNDYPIATFDSMEKLEAAYPRHYEDKDYEVAVLTLNDAKGDVCYA